MIILDHKIHVRLMIWCHCVLVPRGASLEFFNQIHSFWYSRDSWTELSRVPGFPCHHFGGVHIRSFTHPHGVPLGLSGWIWYIWRYTRAYFPFLAVEAIVLSQIHYSFHHSAERYYIRLIHHYSCDVRRDELSVEHDVRVLIALIAMTLQWIVTLRLRRHDLVGSVVRLCSQSISLSWLASRASFKIHGVSFRQC